jgi:hypothetical protein
MFQAMQDHLLHPRLVKNVFQFVIPHHVFARVGHDDELIVFVFGSHPFFVQLKLEKAAEEHRFDMRVLFDIRDRHEK